MSDYTRAATLHNVAEKYNQTVLDAALITNATAVGNVMTAMANAASTGKFSYTVTSVNAANAGIFGPWLQSLGYLTTYDSVASTLTINW